MKRISVFIGLFIAIFVMGPVGCGGAKKPDGLPALFPCAVTIQQEGKPLEEAIVTLVSTTDVNSKWIVRGMTDAQGVAAMVTYAQFPGAPEGTYKVVVEKAERFQEKPPEVIPGGDGTQMTQGSPVILYSLVEKQYSNAATTTLEAKVEKGKNSLNFDVGKSVREKEETAKQ